MLENVLDKWIMAVKNSKIIALKCMNLFKIYMYKRYLCVCNGNVHGHTFYMHYSKERRDLYYFQHCKNLRLKMKTNTC